MTLHMQFCSGGNGKFPMDATFQDPYNKPRNVTEENCLDSNKSDVASLPPTRTYEPHSPTLNSTPSHSIGTPSFRSVSSSFSGGSSGSVENIHSPEQSGHSQFQINRQMSDRHSSHMLNNSSPSIQFPDTITEQLRQPLYHSTHYTDTTLNNEQLRLRAVSEIARQQLDQSSKHSAELMLRYSNQKQPFESPLTIFNDREQAYIRERNEYKRREGHSELVMRESYSPNINPKRSFEQLTTPQTHSVYIRRAISPHIRSTISPQQHTIDANSQRIMSSYPKEYDIRMIDRIPQLNPLQIEERSIYNEAVHETKSIVDKTASQQRLNHIPVLQHHTNSDISLIQNHSQPKSPNFAILHQQHEKEKQRQARESSILRNVLQQHILPVQYRPDQHTRPDQHIRLDPYINPAQHIRSEQHIRTDQYIRPDQHIRIEQHIRPEQHPKSDRHIKTEQLTRQARVKHHVRLDQRTQLELHVRSEQNGRPKQHSKLEQQIISEHIGSEPNVRHSMELLDRNVKTDDISVLDLSSDIPNGQQPLDLTKKEDSKYAINIHTQSVSDLDDKVSNDSQTKHRFIVCDVETNNTQSSILNMCLTQQSAQGSERHSSLKRKFTEDDSEEENHCLNLTSKFVVKEESVDRSEDVIKKEIPLGNEVNLDMSEKPTDFHTFLKLKKTYLETKKKFDLNMRKAISKNNISVVNPINFEIIKKNQEKDISSDLSQPVDFSCLKRSAILIDSIDDDDHKTTNDTSGNNHQEVYDDNIDNIDVTNVSLDEIKNECLDLTTKSLSAVEDNDSFKSNYDELNLKSDTLSSNFSGDAKVDTTYQQLCEDEESILSMKHDEISVIDASTEDEVAFHLKSSTFVKDSSSKGNMPIDEVISPGDIVQCDKVEEIDNIADIPSNDNNDNSTD